MKTSIFLMVFVSLLWSVSYNTYAQCHLRLVGDVNGDTLADIVGFGANQVSVALGNRDGRFAAPIDVFSNFSNADGWRVGEHLRYLADVNGDRRVDIVGFGANQVSVALGRTDGRFDAPINSFNRFTNADGWRVSEHLRYLADVNGDSLADIVGFGATQVSVALGQRDGRFDSPIDVFNNFTIAQGWRVGEHLRELADVNGDGRADIVGFGANEVYLALGQRDGRFAAPIAISPRFTMANGWFVGQQLRKLADVNGDGRADIVGFSDNLVSVALGQPDGALFGYFNPPFNVFNHFTKYQGWEIGKHLRELADVNGDGRADIVGFGENGVFVSLGQETGRFAPPTEVFSNFSNADGWRVGEHLRYLADVNGDQKADIIGFGTERVAIALGRTDGRFGAPNGVLSHFTTVNGGWTTCPEQQNQDVSILRGWVDMHTHPMSHLSMGGKVMYGSPDGNMASALANCNSFHGGPGIDNIGGDIIRAEVVNNLDEKYEHQAKNALHKDHPHGGYPSFTNWPHWSSATHQQMWWEWIKRAHDGGLNIMVALAVHNGLINKAAAGVGDRVWDDKASVELQLTEMKQFITRHAEFMEIAKTPSDLRRIVVQGKLAVILGVETEDIGNLARRKYFEGENITPDKISAEIQRLYNQFDVRYILPIHFSNNLFGGTALTRNLFLLSTKYYTNTFPSPIESQGESIGYKLGREPFKEFLQADLLRSRGLGWIIDHQPTYPIPCLPCGQRNSLGLTEEGKIAIDEMMRLGMMIDIDHMSEQAVRETITHITNRAGTAGYPINSGHNGLRTITDRPSAEANENSKTESQYRTILNFGGMIGLGHGGSATGFVNSFRNVSRIAQGRNVAIGTDVNGFYPLAEPDPAARITYNLSFPRYESPIGRPWDINTDGFAHYGLFPDYIKSWESAGMTPSEKEIFFSSAEYFAQMWEKCERRKSAVR